MDKARHNNNKANFVNSTSKLVFGSIKRVTGVHILLISILLVIFFGFYFSFPAFRGRLLRLKYLFQVNVHKAFFQNDTKMVWTATLICEDGIWSKVDYESELASLSGQLKPLFDKEKANEEGQRVIVGEEYIQRLYKSLNMSYNLSRADNIEKDRIEKRIEELKREGVRHEYEKPISIDRTVYKFLYIPYKYSLSYPPNRDIYPYERSDKLPDNCQCKGEMKEGFCA